MLHENSKCILAINKLYKKCESILTRDLLELYYHQGLQKMH